MALLQLVPAGDASQGKNGGRGQGAAQMGRSPQTPYQRLLATGVLSQEQQERLQALYEQTNPLLLREEIYAGLAALWDAALAQNGTAA